MSLPSAVVSCLCPFIVHCSIMFTSLQPHGQQYTRLPCSSLSPRVCSNSWRFCWWCHQTILSSVTLFYSCLQPFPASGSFPTSRTVVLEKTLESPLDSMEIKPVYVLLSIHIILLFKFCKLLQITFVSVGWKK